MPEWTLRHFWGLSHWCVSWVFTCWYVAIWTVVWGRLPEMWVTMVSLLGTYSLSMWGNKPRIHHIGSLMLVFLTGWLIQPWSPAAFILSPADWTNRRHYQFRSRQQGLTNWGWYWSEKPGIVSQGKELILLVIQEWSDNSESGLRSGIYGTSCVTLVATVLTAVDRAPRKLLSRSCLSMDVYFMMGVWSFKSSRPISSKQESLLLEAILEKLEKRKSPNAKCPIST